MKIKLKHYLFKIEIYQTKMIDSGIIIKIKSPTKLDKEEVFKLKLPNSKM
jgi:hypothetical protein